jgi:LemA protein
VVERYPDLKANSNFMKLQDELAGSENRIATARTRYNKAVGEFNSARRKFFKSVVAGVLGLEKRDFFEITNEADREVPTVDFNK